ncbi:nitrate reductase molybdenum cofactor assembly chaperone [Nocardia veterana]|uniref:Nitrate reductase molybdenum cofactor assembly chaperone n=1 Tax=Nocardia veterana TaxID=132249 RepID=A0A7X6LZN6_9NOCA|nr:nitrate reductase molybdenum cofactor assembly chaperone [Nocardia veterana]NKY86800.1 nitrate reductase molybdenum cofactor assembly chaperone [Nocardia veterana]
MGLLTLRRRPTPVVEMSERDRRLVWRISSLLLDYPGPDTLAMLDDLSEAAATLPEPVRADLGRLLTHLAGTEPLVLARDYVETFDLRRRASLHLTYYAYGDTRKRGMALLRFKHAYRHAGAELSDHELPDHLPVLLEFAATVDPIGGERLLGEHVPVLEMLRLSLTDSRSPYADALAAVLSTLPPPTTADRRRIAELAAQGPPDEDVGLEPYSMNGEAMHPAMNPDLYSPPTAGNSAGTGLFAGSGDRR